MRLFGLILISVTCLVSCTPEPFDAESAAEEYCKCLKENNSPKDYVYASAICGAELLKANRYYRLYHIDLGDAQLQDKLSAEATDSTKKFIFRFNDKIRNECCREELNCL